MTALAVSGDWPGGAGAAQSIPISITSSSGGKLAVSVLLKAQGVKLWWPRGMGAQAMYNITAKYTAGTETGAGTAGLAGVRYITECYNALVS
jgi:hypothetical protein